MRKVLFLDRDGVINSDVGHYYIYKCKDFKLNDGIIEAMQLAVSNGFDLIFITNQGGIAKGEYSKTDVEKVHNYLLELLKDHKIDPLAIYYCPHHNKIENCLCRKPGGLNIEKALARFHISKEKSFMIGDNQKDVDAAFNAGVKGFLIQSNENILPLVKELLNEQ